MSLHLPCSILTSERNPSHLISKTQSLCEKGLRARPSVKGWKCMRETVQIISKQAHFPSARWGHARQIPSLWAKFPFPFSRRPIKPILLFTRDSWKQSLASLLFMKRNYDDEEMVGLAEVIR